MGWGDHLVLLEGWQGVACEIGWNQEFRPCFFFRAILRDVGWEGEGGEV
jgi:hypothetical protein